MCLSDLCFETWLQFANFLRLSSSLGSDTSCVLQMLLDSFSSHGSVQCPALALTTFSPSPSGHKLAGCWCRSAFTWMQGTGLICTAGKEVCEARYQIQEETCRSLEEAWDRGEEPPHQTLNVAPASWPCTGYGRTNTAMTPGRRRSPTPSGCNL